MRGRLVSRLDRIERQFGTGKPTGEILVIFVERRDDGRVYEQDGLRLREGVQQWINGPWRKVNHAGT